MDTTSEDYRKKLQKRLAPLVGGVAIINVGAATDTERKEKNHKNFAAASIAGVCSSAFRTAKREILSITVAHASLEGIVERPHAHLIPPAPPIPAQPAHASTALCTHCLSPDTELLAMMQRHTCDADDWVQCHECGHLFTTPRWARQQL